jgi:hypothetical protein
LTKFRLLELLESNITICLVRYSAGGRAIAS